MKNENVRDRFAEGQTMLPLRRKNMTNVKWLGATGVMLVLSVAGCTPTLRELGDEPEAGAGPTGSVIPKGGSAHGTQGGAAQGGATHTLPEGGATTDPSPGDGGASVDPGPSMGGAALTDSGAGCQTDDGIFASGEAMPDPFSCNSCVCEDGKIASCTEIGCPKECPPNSMPALGCLDCVDGECRLAHYACFTSQYVDCHDGGCFASSACGDQLP